jgi:membrane protein
MLTSLYHQSLPVRRPWRRALPGAILPVVLWIFGSYLLRMYLEVVFGHELVYGALAAPVAALLFFYVTALAVLLGAELNAAIDSSRRIPHASPHASGALKPTSKQAAGPADDRAPDFANPRAGSRPPTAARPQDGGQ